MAGESQWLRRFRATDPTDQAVIFGHFPRPKTPFPAYPTEVETKVVSIRDAPPAHLQRVPGLKAILYYRLCCKTYEEIILSMSGPPNLS